MIHFAAKEAKNNFGRLLDTARQQPVTIDKQGRAVAVLLSNEEYLRLEGLEEAFLNLRVKLAEQDGSIDFNESEKFINDLINA